MAAANAIEISDVTKRFDGHHNVLDGISLVIRDGEFLTIVGPSGSGKTTLLRLINRLTDPTSGTVSVRGENIEERDPIPLRREIGYVFQGAGLFPHMTVAENIAITPKLLGWDKAKRVSRVIELLKLVQLDPKRYRSRFPAELSGGERQRVGVARALAAEPKIVLMDEPFGALDALTRAALQRDYRELHDKLGLTTMMITHDLAEAALLADRIAVIHQGMIVEQGTPRELMASPKNDYVRKLVETPKHQAERLAALIKGGA
jgi:osmoprotectant transport system ATP-binding protein